MPRSPLLVSARTPRRALLLPLLTGLALAATVFLTHRSEAQTVPAPYDCRSTDPQKWPPSSKPYFMVALDTSGSMDGTVAGAAPSCAGYPSTRVGHARCALANMVKAYAGEVNFGLATFPMELQPRGSAAGVCGDGIKNGAGGAAETDVDCGGSTCRKCITGQVCAVNGDCVSNSCSAGKVCNPITCPNNFLNGGGGGNVTGINCAVNQVWTGTNTSSCGNSTSGGAGTTGAAQRGADVLVPLPADDYWDTPPTSTPNSAALLAYVDNQCGDCKELFSGGFTPLNGVMRDLQRYLSTSWSAPNGAAWNGTPAGPPTYTTPLTGTERSCRSVNIILITDGGETCPTDNNATQASATATSLRTAGWNIGSTLWTAKTYVIDVGGATPATGSANIATAGGTTAIAAVNEVALSQGLANIIAGSVAAETCDNVDNNCNGCIDEGSKLYCSRNKTARTLAYLNTAANTKTLADCCTWTTPAERTACLGAYSASITGANPKGSQWFLPCWDPAGAGGMTNPESKWLCSDPGETCDNLDNNCDQQVLTTAVAPAPLFSSNVADEQQPKCGSPAHCPQPEVCPALPNPPNGLDDDCDGVIDNAVGSGVPGSICPGNCVPSPEICNGCDDDCDGVADNGISPLACGFSPPANCAGTRTCAPVAVATRGACIAGVTKPGVSQFTACSATPGATDVTCDNLDDNCNGVIDEGAPAVPCTNGFPALVYKDVNPLSACVKGLQACHSASCIGWIGPSQEVCNGIDDDCDGLVDAADPSMTGVGASCGSVQGICTKGTTACVGGAVVCTGGTQPQPEICDGIDNNCNGQTDETPLTDGPLPGATGCWQNAGNTCTFNTLLWSAPANGACNGLGTLTAPCQAGSLVCQGASKWACVGGVLPAAEACDGVDNNCNGTVDENNPGGGGVCNSVPGGPAGTPCAGTAQCTAGKLTCNGPGPTPEICDGKDNDCDGLVDAADPDLVGVGTTCGSGLGTCKTGILACVSGAPVCQGEIKPGVEVCDGLDNDCNGAIDDNPTDTPAALGCWNTLPGACSGGGKTWTAPPGGTCTGVGTLTAPCSAGQLVCAGASKWVCQGGVLPIAEACDGVDNDCNGTIDNGNPGGSTKCGTAPNIAPCTQGTLNCVAGQLLCQGEVKPGTEVCNGLDDDCDGTPDDNITTGVGNACGSNQGICKKGLTACVSGAIQCSGEVKAGTETCNGLDDDCDGIPDNNLSDAPANPNCWTAVGTDCTFKTVSWTFPPGATCTSVGSLATPCKTGTLACVGATGWTCRNDVPPIPEVCDGVDNDCKNGVDDGNPGGGAPCGSSTGACTPGTRQCQNGTLVCTGGTPPGPEVCDGIDNNCDGFIDEPQNLVGLGQICGSNIGTCKSGIMVCDAVTHKPVCQGQVTGTPEICDGKDNDCNNAIDDNPTDTPADPGCWQNPGTQCSFSTVKWDPPAGGTCTTAGTLSTPCKPGALVCSNGGWQCAGGRLPQASEVCDNVDNDCNGQVDDNTPGVGVPCPGGTNVGECRAGTIQCTGGQLTCIGQIPPAQEICDNKDNNCNGQTDENAPGSDVPCTGQCSTGKTKCIAGALICQTPVQAAPEVCNGLDDDCNGLVDDGVLDDAPANPNCWNNPGSTCSFQNATWDPPPGGACDQLAPLTAPCQMGRLRCDGTKLWACVGGKLPTAEICDGQDQNCDGQIDNATFPNDGKSCGSAIGTCTLGTLHCVNGQPDVCTGGQGPKPEECNGKDDNCNNLIDDGLPLGDPCNMAYDAIAYPGDRTQGTCQKGKLRCDPSGSGSFICEGGKGPQPEVCNGFDDDCDGKIDEEGAAPNGIAGSVDPSDPTRHVGDLCGSNAGACKQGHLACKGGQIQCDGDIRPSPEICDCKDNNCDGKVDEDPTAPATLCGAGTVCAKSGASCFCAPKCKSGEFKCPLGQDCQPLPLSSDPATTGNFCVNPNAKCQNCGSSTIADECGPAGTLDSGGRALPVCACAGEACHGPCFGVTCGTGSACVTAGDFAGQCRSNTDCRFFEVCGAGKACNAGTCVSNPCVPNPCKAGEVCKPSPAFDRARCEPSCANVSCKATERCVDGTCAPTGCTTACTNGDLCLSSGGDAGGTCGPSKCKTANGDPVCNDGSYCDPFTGACGNDPCEGVKCPGSQVCEAGECAKPPATGAGGAGGGGNADGGGNTTSAGGAGTNADSGNTTSAGGAGTNGGSGNAGAGHQTPPSKEVIGLATGGGGCRCDLPSRGTPSRGALALSMLALTVLVTRRRTRQEGGAR